MITNLYEFYLDDSKNSDEKSKLQEVNQVESSIDMDLNTSDSDSVDISRITQDSEKLGRTYADKYFDLIAPAVKVAKDEFVRRVGSKLNSSNETSVALVHSSNDQIETQSKSTKDIITQLESDLTLILGEATQELFKGELTTVQSTIEELKLTEDNEIAEHSFETQLKDHIFSEFNVNVPELDKYEDLGGYIANEFTNMAHSVANTAIEEASHITESVLKAATSVVDTLVLDSWMDPARAVMKTAESTIQFTAEIVEEISKQVKGLMSGINDSENIIVDAFTKDLVGYGTNWVRTNITEVTQNMVVEARGFLKGAARSFVSSLPWETGSSVPPNVKLYDFMSIRPRDKHKYFPNFMGNNWQYLRTISDPENVENRTYYRFATSFDWLIKIVPNTENLPSLNTLLNLDENSYLPILNYSITEAGLESVSYSFLSNSIIVPQGYRRPSRLSITLPDMYVDTTKNNGKMGNEGKTYLRQFKDLFIDYVKDVSNHQVYSLVNRDYRECCYRITIYRFPYVSTNEANKSIDKFSFHKTYLGIPEISINESGNDSKQLITDVLNFNIVGEYE